MFDPKNGYYKKAKREGFRSRAAYKLVEIDQRYHVFKPRARVIDLGCSPGGWTQVAQSKVGRNGRIIGLDLRKTEPFDLPNITVLVLDVMAPTSIEQVRQALGGKANVVLSDMAPDTSGVGFADHTKSVELAYRALDIAKGILATNGTLVFKVFEGPELKLLVSACKKNFETLRRVKPRASRKSSRELYFVCKVKLPEEREYGKKKKGYPQRNSSECNNSSGL